MLERKFSTSSHGGRCISGNADGRTDPISGWRTAFPLIAIYHFMAGFWHRISFPRRSRRRSRYHMDFAPSERADNQLAVLLRHYYALNAYKIYCTPSAERQE